MGRSVEGRRKEKREGKAKGLVEGVAGQLAGGGRGFFLLGPVVRSCPSVSCVSEKVV